MTRAIYENVISNHCKRLNRVIRYVHDHKAPVRLAYLDCKSSKLTAYYDAALARITELSYLPVRIVLLTDNCHISTRVLEKSYRSQSVTRYALPVEVMALLELFEMNLRSVRNSDLLKENKYQYRYCMSPKVCLLLFLEKISPARSELCLIYMSLTSTFVIRRRQ